MSTAPSWATSPTGTAIGVLQRSVAWFADDGVRGERILSDNGSAYKSHVWRDTCTELGITRKRTRPYRPQTNGKICEYSWWRRNVCLPGGRDLIGAWPTSPVTDLSVPRPAAHRPSRVNGEQVP